MWTKTTDSKPESDQNVFGINEKVTMLPVLVYYDSLYDEFMSLNCLQTVPVSITHWMRIPELPQKEIANLF